MSQKIAIMPHPEKEGQSLAVTVSDPQLEEIEQRKEDLNFSSRSEALRYFIQIGMNSIVENDPRNRGSVDSNVIAPKVRDFVPEGEENAIPIINGDDETETLVEKIENEILDIVDEDPEIIRDGWEVYQ
jgi:hypothetical protein